MIAIGVTWLGVSAPDPLTLLPSGEFAIVVAQTDDAATPRSRLALQARATLGLPSFLPLSARGVMTPELAQQWVARHSGPLKDSLERLADCCQMVLDLQQTGPVPQQPRDWLPYRAARVRVPALLVAELVPLARQATSHPTSQGSMAHFLLARSNWQEFGAAVTAICGDRALNGWSALLSGPWSPVSFIGVGQP